MLSADHVFSKPGLEQHVDALLSWNAVHVACQPNMTYLEHHAKSIACSNAE